MVEDKVLVCVKLGCCVCIGALVLDVQSSLRFLVVWYSLCIQDHGMAFLVVGVVVGNLLSEEQLRLIGDVGIHHSVMGDEVMYDIYYHHHYDTLHTSKVAEELNVQRLTL